MDSKRIQKILQKANKLADLEEYESAIKNYDMVLKIDPANIAAIVCRDMACRPLKKTSIHTERFFKKFDMDLPTMYHLGAQMLVEHKEYAIAIDIFNIVAEMRPENHLVHFNMGVAFFNYSKKKKKDLLAKALKCYEKSLKLKPDFVNAAHNKTEVLLCLKRYDQAIKHCDELLETDPNDTKALEQKAFSFDYTYEYQKALECYDRMLEINPKNGITMYNKSISLSHMRRTEEALEMLDRAVSFEPSLKRSTSLRKSLTAQLEYEKSLKSQPNLDSS